MSVHIPVDGGLTASNGQASLCRIDEWRQVVPHQPAPLTAPQFSPSAPRPG
jgi:hypothetical protein